MSTDPLVFMPVERWSELKAAFKSDLPRSISGFILLEAQEYILKSGLDYGFKIYCPFGDVNNGIVALNIKPTLYEVIIQCPKDDTKELEESLKNTKIIDWGKFAMVPYAPKHVVECVKKLYLAKNCKINHMIETTTFVLDKGVLPYDVRIPSGLSFELLTLDYLQLINEKWPYKYPGSEWIYELLIKAKLGYGLFDGKKLLAWIFIKEMGALGHLYTMDEYRRKGYGELTLKLMSNLLLKEGKYVVAHCSVENWTAANLYKKLGFESVDEVFWCYLDNLLINKNVQ